MDGAIKNYKDELTMKLLHYFITEENYQPIVLHGGNQNEFWLENLNAPYKIVRIMGGYIHNKEQLEFDIFKSEDILSKIKKKTFSFKMNALSIMMDLNDNVQLNDTNHIDYVNINDEADLTKYENIKEVFPTIIDKLNFKEDGLDLIVKITNDINHKNKAQSDHVASIFKKDKPIATYILMAINIIVFLMMYFFGAGSEDNVTLVKFGALVGDYVTLGEYYRLITSMFVHIGIFHILFNMYALYILGPQIENFFGRAKFIIIYLFSGIIGNLLTIIFMPHYISAGASGGIFGLLGALVYFGYHYRVYLGNVLRTQIIPVVIINLAIGFTLPGINQVAHVGGLLSGYLITMAVGLDNKTSKIEKINAIIVSILLTIFLLYIFITK